jgi:hypothetical protein
MFVTNPPHMPCIELSVAHLLSRLLRTYLIAASLSSILSLLHASMLVARVIGYHHSSPTRLLLAARLRRPCYCSIVIAYALPRIAKARSVGRRAVERVVV